MQTSEDPLSKETWKIWKAAFDQVAVNHERAQQALELWREFFESGAGPWALNGYIGDDMCFFCDAWREDGEHADDCIYIRAKALFDKR